MNIFKVSSTTPSPTPGLIVSSSPSLNYKMNTGTTYNPERWSKQMMTSASRNGITENSFMTSRYEETRKLFTVTATTDNQEISKSALSSPATLNIAYSKQINVVSMILLIAAACIVFSLILVVCVFTSFCWRGHRHGQRTEDRYYTESITTSFISL